MSRTSVEILLIEKEKNRQKISVLQKEKEDALTRVNELETKETEMNRLLPRLTDSHVEWRDMDLYRIMLNEEKKVLQDFIRDKDKELSVAATAVAQVDKIVQEFDRKRKYDEEYSRKELTGKITGIGKDYEKRLRKSEVRLAGLNGTLADLQEALEKEKQGNVERDRLRPEVRAMEEKVGALEKSVSAEQNRAEERLSKHVEDTAALSGELSALGMSVQSMQKQLEEYRAASEAVQREQESIPAVMEEKVRALEKGVSAELGKVEEKLSELLDDTLKLSEEIIALDMSFQSILKQLQEYNIGSDMTQRGQKRLHVAIPVIYSEVSKADDTDMVYQQHGTTYDYSESGLSFYTPKPLFEGTGIHILCKGIWNERRAGSVRWCKTIKYNLYLVGVSLQ